MPLPAVSSGHQRAASTRLLPLRRRPVCRQCRHPTRPCVPPCMRSRALHPRAAPCPRRPHAPRQKSSQHALPVCTPACGRVVTRRGRGGVARGACSTRAPARPLAEHARAAPARAHLSEVDLDDLAAVGRGEWRQRWARARREQAARLARARWRRLRGGRQRWAGSAVQPAPSGAPRTRTASQCSEAGEHGEVRSAERAVRGLG